MGVGHHDAFQYHNVAKGAESRTSSMLCNQQDHALDDA
jgi:hypothetical protein